MSRVCTDEPRIELTATFDQSRFENPVFRRDRVALEDVSQAMLNSIVGCDLLRQIFGLAISTGDHFAQRPLLEKSNLAKLLTSFSIIRAYQSTHRYGDWSGYGRIQRLLSRARDRFGLCVFGKEQSMNMTAPEKLAKQIVDIQWWVPFGFLTSLLPAKRGWFANHAQQRQLRCLAQSRVVCFPRLTVLSMSFG